jgi:hypothetical protein
MEIVIKFIRIVAKMPPRFPLIRQRYFQYLTYFTPSFFKKRVILPNEGFNFILEAAFANKSELEPVWRSKILIILMLIA